MGSSLRAAAWNQCTWTLSLHRIPGSGSERNRSVVTRKLSTRYVGRLSRNPHAPTIARRLLRSQRLTRTLRYSGQKLWPIKSRKSLRVCRVRTPLCYRWHRQCILQPGKPQKRASTPRYGLRLFLVDKIFLHPVVVDAYTELYASRSRGSRRRALVDTGTGSSRADLAEAIDTKKKEGGSIDQKY